MALLIGKTRSLSMCFLSDVFAQFSLARALLIVNACAALLVGLMSAASLYLLDAMITHQLAQNRNKPAPTAARKVQPVCALELGLNSHDGSVPDQPMEASRIRTTQTMTKTLRASA